MLPKSDVSQETLAWIINRLICTDEWTEQSAHSYT